MRSPAAIPAAATKNAIAPKTAALTTGIAKKMFITIAALTIIAQIRPTLQTLPDGDYRYRDSFALDRPYREIQFRKQERYITGSDSDKRTGKSYCFRGIALHNNVINVTVATEIASQTSQQTEWKFAPGNSINFDRLYPLQVGPGLELYKCLTPFLPKLQSRSIVSY